MTSVVIHRTNESAAAGDCESTRVMTGEDGSAHASEDLPYSADVLSFDLSATVLERMCVEDFELASGVAAPAWLRMAHAVCGAGAIALIDRWLADTSGHDEAVWPDLARALNEDRLSDRFRLAAP